MDTNFGFFTSDVVAIRDWHQLLKISSKIKNVSCAVNDISDSVCSGISITIFNTQTNFDYITFFVEGDNSKTVRVSELIVDSDTAVKILNCFGFPIIYVVKPEITRETRNVLSALKTLGYNFICKNRKNVIYASQFNDQNKMFETGVMVTDVIPASITCDFSFMNISTIYSIEDLVSTNWGVYE